MKLGKFVKDLKFKTVNRIQAAKYAKTDFGIVKVAFMIAALDGEITADEFRAFEALLKKCRGYSVKAAAVAREEAMRAAGYLMLYAKCAKESEIVNEFIKEAQMALPNGFAYLSIEEVRRAVVTWIAMGLSDGDYSTREKKCIEALRKLFAELKITHAAAEDERWMALSPAYHMAYGSTAWTGTVNLIPKNFVAQVEDLVKQYGDTAEAAKELENLIRAE